MVRRLWGWLGSGVSRIRWVEMLGEDGGGDERVCIYHYHCTNALGLERMYHHSCSFVFIVTRYVLVLV